METFPLPAQPIEGHFECYRNTHGGESTLTISTKLHNADAVKEFIKKAKKDLPSCSIDEDHAPDGTKKIVIKVTTDKHLSTRNFDQLDNLGKKILKTYWSNF